MGLHHHRKRPCIYLLQGLFVGLSDDFKKVLINIPLSSFVSATYRDFRIFVPSLILIKVILVFFGSLSFRIIVYQPPENH